MAQVIAPILDSTEAAVHRVAAIRPQLEHKPTWRGHQRLPFAFADDEAGVSRLTFG
jgi:hypothetical protein